MPIISPKEVLAALEAGMKEGGYDEFSNRIAVNPKMFGDIVFFALKHRYPQWSFVRVDDLRFKVSADADHGMTLKLHRFFSMLSPHNAESCLRATARVIADYDLQIASLADRPSHDMTMDQVVPLLKSREAVERSNAEMSRDSKAPNNRFATWEVVEGVMASAAFDTPDKFVFLTSREMEKLGVGIDEVREAAVANVRRLMADMELLDFDDPLVPEEGGVAVLGKIGGFASSILMVDEFWEKQIELCGEPLNILPRATDEILVWRSSDMESTAGIFLALLSGDEKAMLPGKVFVYGGDGLHVFEPDSRHETVARIH